MLLERGGESVKRKDRGGGKERREKKGGEGRIIDTNSFLREGPMIFYIVRVSSRDRFLSSVLFPRRSSGRFYRYLQNPPPAHSAREGKGSLPFNKSVEFIGRHNSLMHDGLF